MSVSQSEPTLSADNDVSADIDGSSVLALTVEIPIISHTLLCVRSTAMQYVQQYTTTLPY